MTSICKWAAGLMVLAAVVFAAGCGGDAKDKDKKADKEKAAKDGKDKKEKEKGKEEEHSEGPHKGAIAEWGEEEFHAEFTVDPKTKTARVYILGPDAKNWKAAPIKADKVTLSVTKPTAFQVELKPEKQSGDPEGTASVFVGTHDGLGKDEKFEGTLSAKVGDKPPYSGDFKVKK
jgi:hypothetical protein